MDEWLFEEGIGPELGVDVVFLHGKLTSLAQDSVIRSRKEEAPSSLVTPERRVVLATPIAESSLTIDGIGVVVDSGLRKSPVFNARTGEWLDDPLVCSDLFRFIFSVTISDLSKATIFHPGDPLIFC